MAAGGSAADAPAFEALAARDGNRVLFNLPASEDECARVGRPGFPAEGVLLNGTSPIGAAATTLRDQRSLNLQLMCFFNQPARAVKPLAVYVRHLFWSVPLHRVYVQLPLVAGATSYIRLLAGAGFKQEGVVRGHALVDGRARDVAVIGLLRRDFEAWCRENESRLALRPWVVRIMDPARAIERDERDRVRRVLDGRRELNLAMGAGGRSKSSSTAPPMLLRSRRGGEAVGVVENHELPGNVAVFVVYIDRQRGLAGFGSRPPPFTSATCSTVGARLVTAEVLVFNTEMNTILRKVRLVPQARLREHVYAGGRFWDVLVYSFDRAEWVRIIDRYRRSSFGGARRPAASGRRP